MDEEVSTRPRIVVVGPCAAGKTTLVENLRPKGYDIRACAQEHSGVPHLWLTFSRADVLIYLDVELPTIAARQRRTDWTPERLARQRRRLAHARASCHLYLPTDRLSIEQVAEVVENFLHERGIVPGDAQDAR